MWYWIFIGAMVPALGIAWLWYWWHEHKLDREEQQMPKLQKGSEHLRKSRTEVSDWAQKMAEYKPPKPPTRTGNSD